MRRGQTLATARWVKGLTLLLVLAGCVGGAIALIALWYPYPQSSPTSAAQPASPSPTLTLAAPATPTNPAPTSTPAPAPTETAAAPSSTPTVTRPPAPSPTPISTRRPEGRGSVTVSESSVTFQAYPYRAYWQPKQDTATGFIFQALDRSGYDQAARVPPAPQTFRTIVLENPYLRVVVLPDLGGRLFQITNKPTGQNLLYNNRVLKPTHWGPDNQGGWLAAGGIEWALPVQEHGYEWGIPWQSAVTQDEAGISVTLTDSTSNDRVRARIRITLPAEAAYVEIRPRLENPTGRAVRLQFWLNAQLTLGANKNVSPGTEFVIPASSVLVHSTGNAFIPGGNVPLARRAAAPLDWPIVAGRDLSRYANWENYLGIFAAPERPFVGAYNHDTGLGVARIFPWEQAPHVKLFAFGPRFCCRQEIADDDSDYFELWGGLPRTFFPDDDVTLGPGEAREWAEYWVPFARTGGLTAASRDAVLFLRREGNSMQIAAYSAVPRAATLVLQGVETRRWEVSLAPGAPFTARAPAEPGKLRLQLVEAGRVLLEAAEQ